MKNQKQFTEGDMVVYIPTLLLNKPAPKRILNENLGVVTSLNSKFIFVRYINHEISQATRREDLYSINNRTDLIEIVQNDLKQRQDANNL